MTEHDELVRRREMKFLLDATRERDPHETEKILERTQYGHLVGY